MHTVSRYAPAAALALLAAAVGCNDFLTGGQLTNDPNRPTSVSTRQLVVSTQANLWAEMSSDPARWAAMWTQQLQGAQQQYVPIYEYGISEATTNFFHQALYLGGGLVDLRNLERQARDAGDSLTLGIGQVTEGALIGTGADLFGDLVYSKAYTGPNPELDPQLTVYDQIQAVLDTAIVNLAAPVGPKNAGPTDADLVYGGDPAPWTKLAHTLKARFYLHTAEVRPEAYALALAEAPQGINDPADNYHAAFSGRAGEQNFWYKFDVVERSGYLAPDPHFVSYLGSRNDPRLATYFNADTTDLNAVLLAPDYPQPLVTANENLLIWAEAAYRTGDQATALSKLNEELALAGLPAQSGLAGNDLLAAILDEKYTALFQTVEPWNDYKRTCWPNLVPVTTPPQSIPARLLYDTAERQTNTNVPPASAQPARNANDPANAHPDPAPDQVCFGQQGTAPAAP